MGPAGGQRRACLPRFLIDPAVEAKSVGRHRLTIAQEFGLERDAGVGCKTLAGSVTGSGNLSRPRGAVKAAPAVPTGLVGDNVVLSY
jgi:hypothetical protein